MNKENIFKNASKVFNIEPNDEFLMKCWEIVCSEHFNEQLPEDLWTTALITEYAFCSGNFPIWKEYQVKFNQAYFGGKNNG